MAASWVVVLRVVAAAVVLSAFGAFFYSSPPYPLVVVPVPSSHHITSTTMSMAATHAARAAGGAGSISTSTLALVGLGGFVLANPEKALVILQKALLAISDNGGGGSGERNVTGSPTPIVIHAGGGGPAMGGGGGGAGRGVYGVLVQLSVGAGLCWGSYALLINVLPEQAKNMLPVTQGTFKTAVSSLGKGLLQVKDALSAELANLLTQQSELAHKQDETHEQVLYVQDQVSDVHDDVHRVRTAVDDCQDALSATDKRTTYIARGMRLVTRGMTALLPPDDVLAQELRTFHKMETGHDNTTATSAAVTAPRHRPEDKATTRGNRSDGSRASAGSRRSRASQQRSRRHRREELAATPSRNKPSSSDDDHYHHHDDTLSVSTGTPVRAVVVPVHKAGTAPSEEASITSTPNKELEEVRALLEQYGNGRSSL